MTVAEGYTRRHACDGRLYSPSWLWRKALLVAMIVTEGFTRRHDCDWRLYSSPWLGRKASLAAMIVTNLAGVADIFRFLFVICHHFLNGTRSPTTCISRFTDKKENNHNLGDWRRSLATYGLYWNYRRVRSTRNPTICPWRFTDKRDSILTQGGLGTEPLPPSSIGTERG